MASSTTEEHPTCLGGVPFAVDGLVAGDDGRAEATRTGGPRGGRGKGEGEVEARANWVGGTTRDGGTRERDTTGGRTRKMTSRGNENQKNDLTREPRLTLDDVARPACLLGLLRTMTSQPDAFDGTARTQIRNDVARTNAMTSQRTTQ